MRLFSTYLNSCVSGFQSGTGIFRTFVPGGRKFRRQTCTAKLPSSQIYRDFSNSNQLTVEKDVHFEKIAYRKSGEPSIDLQRRRGRELWMAHMVRHVGSEAPVVRAVLE